MTRRNIYPAPHYEGFDPYESEGDRWLYEESHGDSRLLFMLLTYEALQQRRVEYEQGESFVFPDQEVFDSVQKQIEQYYKDTGEPRP